MNPFAVWAYGPYRPMKVFVDDWCGTARTIFIILKTCHESNYDIKKVTVTLEVTVT